MSFNPYHQFHNRTRLEQFVEQCRNNNTLPTPVADGYDRYHRATIHKLKAAMHHIKMLEGKLTPANIHVAITANSDYMFEVNMYIDAFFYCAGSAMDILARELLIYFGIPLPRDVYFQTARTLIAANRPGDSILPRLADPPWRTQFSKYRNSLTHELILATTYSIHTNLATAAPVQQIVFPLPDDPRIPPAQRTFDNNPNALDYLSQHLKRLLSLCNVIYGEVDSRARTGGALPL